MGLLYCKQVNLQEGALLGTEHVCPYCRCPPFSHFSMESLFGKD